ncbi:hypothetical protein CDAR_263311 [Caerostris darwini]|uniref:Uncharacterized protein n=1 Tax=Caerostris darwini TaxID=1538125 RepID=A0AAV4RTI8_9ARAC|nr:hypothetical protein CDAR_263311 [Caerostris darwini]
MEDIKTSVLFTPMLQTRKEKASWILFFKCFQSASDHQSTSQNNRAECYQKEKSNAHCRTTIDKTPAEKTDSSPHSFFLLVGGKRGWLRCEPGKHPVAAVHQAFRNQYTEHTHQDGDRL